MALTTTHTGLRLVAEGRATGEAGDIFFLDLDVVPATSIPPTATPTMPSTVTVPTVDTPTATATQSAAATPGTPPPTPLVRTTMPAESAIYLSYATMRTRTG